MMTKVADKQKKQGPQSRMKNLTYSVCGSLILMSNMFECPLYLY